MPRRTKASLSRIEQLRKARWAREAAQVVKNRVSMADVDPEPGVSSVASDISNNSLLRVETDVESSSTSLITPVQLSKITGEGQSHKEDVDSSPRRQAPFIRIPKKLSFKQIKSNSKAKEKNICFLCCHGAFCKTKRREIPNPTFKLPAEVSKGVVRSVIQLILRHKDQVLTKRIEGELRDAEYCISCTQDLREIDKLMRHLQRLNDKIRPYKAKLIQHIESNYFKLGANRHRDFTDRDIKEQGLRAEILTGIMERRDSARRSDHSNTQPQAAKSVSRKAKVKVAPSAKIESPSPYHFVKVEYEPSSAVEVTEEDDFFFTNSNSTNGFENFQESIENETFSDFLDWNDDVGMEDNEDFHSVPTKTSSQKSNNNVAAKAFTSVTEVFVCPACDSVFSQEESFKTHEVKCKFKKPNQHSNKEKTKVNRPYQQHRIAVGASPNTKIHRKHPPVEGQCCGKLYRDIHYHKLTTHDTSFNCDHCNSTFTQFIEYNFHLTTHPELNLPPVKCEECGRIFKTNHKLVDHIQRIHEGINPFMCDICGMGAKTKHRLDEHVKTVHEKRQDFACTICDKKFGYPGSLREHLRRHKGEEVRKHSCKLCSKSFKIKGKLQDHIAAVHGTTEPKHICDFCGKKFPIFNYLYIHLRSHETPEQKEARRLKAKLAAEARKLSNKPVLIAKGRPKRIDNGNPSSRLDPMNSDAIIESQVQVEATPADNSDSATCDNQQNEYRTDNVSDLGSVFSLWG